jgi:hypothetical protein
LSVEPANNLRETQIARHRRRGLELGSGCLVAVRAETEKRVQRLKYDPSDEERDLISEVAHYAVRTSRLRAWGRMRESDATSRLLVATIGALKKFRDQKHSV